MKTRRQFLTEGITLIAGATAQAQQWPEKVLCPICQRGFDGVIDRVVYVLDPNKPHYGVVVHLRSVSVADQLWLLPDRYGVMKGWTLLHWHHATMKAELL